MKTLKHLREEYNANFLDQVEYLPDELVLDEAKGSPAVKKLQSIPTPSQMPVVLVFRRITYRTYPDKQVVALYYSKLVDKYLSIPFGPTGNLNLSEAQVVEGKMLDAIKGGVKGAVSGALKGAAVGNVAHLPGMTAGAAIGGAVGAYKGAKKALQNEEEIDEDWQSVNRKDKTDGLSQAAVNAYRRENPGSKLQTAVTEKNPEGKRAARRKSFCSRMSGMKKRLTSAKTARDPDSRINKALRRWNCEEDFKMRLYELRVQQDEGIVGDTIEKGRQYLQSKVKNSKVFKAAQEFGHQLPGYENVKAAKEKFAKGDYMGAAGETATSLGKAALTGAGVAAAGYGAARALPAAISIAKKAKDVFTNDKSDDKEKSTSIITGTSSKSSGDLLRDKPGARTSSSWKKAPDQRQIDVAREKKVLAKQSGAIKENKILDLRNMINEDIESMTLPISGRQVTLNTSMAKRILEVYDSVNTKNKKIVEGMLNEDLESFKKLLNFSIRN